MSGNTLFKYLFSKQTCQNFTRIYQLKFKMVQNENNGLLVLNQSKEKSPNNLSDENNKEDISEFIKTMADQKLNVAREITQVPSQNIEGEQWYFVTKIF